MVWWRKTPGGADESEGLSRRDFFRRFGGGALEIMQSGPPDPTRQPPAPRTLPQRPLGGTGVSVPILGLGTAQLGRRGDEAAAALVNEAIDLGVSYIDTGPESAGWGRAQELVGGVMERRRAEVFLAARVFEPDASAGRRALERTLRELRTEQVDLLCAHALGDDRMAPDVVLGPNGILRGLLQARTEGLCRFLGVTCQSRPNRLLAVLEEYDLDVAVTPANPADAWSYGLRERVWPELRRRRCALVGTKVLGGPVGAGITPALMPRPHQGLAFRYTLSLEGCATAVVGMIDRRELHENVQRARLFHPLDPEEWTHAQQLGRELAEEWGPHLGPVE
jgi:predicted aldo/keto reductase-like oxidoreductase